MSESPPKNKPQRRHITEDEKIQWAQTFQRLMAVSLGAVFFEKQIDFAMHGGLALSLYYGLPRTTQDMDFLIDRQKVHALTSSVVVAVGVVREVYKEAGLNVDLDLTTKTGNENSIWRYKITSSSENIMGSVKVNMEFWPVHVQYILDRVVSGELAKGTENGYSLPSNCVFTGGNILSDKLLALLMRPYVKWSDVFDLSFLASTIKEMELGSILGGMDGHAKAYTVPQYEVLKRRVDAILSHSDEEMRASIRGAFGESGGKLLSGSVAPDAIIDSAPERLRVLLPMALAQFEPSATPAPTGSSAP